VHLKKWWRNLAPGHSCHYFQSIPIPRNICVELHATAPNRFAGKQYFLLRNARCFGFYCWATRSSRRVQGDSAAFFPTSPTSAKTSSSHSLGHDLFCDLTLRPTCPLVSCYFRVLQQRKLKW